MANYIIKGVNDNKYRLSIITFLGNHKENLTTKYLGSNLQNTESLPVSVKTVKKLENCTGVTDEFSACTPLSMVVLYSPSVNLSRVFLLQFSKSSRDLLSTFVSTN